VAKAKKTLTDREKRYKEKKRRKRRSFFKGVFITAIITLAIVAMLSSPIFDVKDIEIKGLERVTEQEIINAGIIKGENIFTISSKTCVELLTQNPYIKSARIVKTYPGKISVTIKERRARAYVEDEGMDYYIVVDETGMNLGTVNIYEYAQDPSLPIVSGISFDNFDTGEFLNQEASKKLETVVLLAQLFEKYGLESADKIDMANLNDIILHIGKYDVLIGTMDGADEKISLFTAAKNQGEIPDFRGTFTIKDPNKPGVFSFLR